MQNSVRITMVLIKQVLVDPFSIIIFEINNKKPVKVPNIVHINVFIDQHITAAV